MGGIPCSIDPMGVGKRQDVYDFYRVSAGSGTETLLLSGVHSYSLTKMGYYSFGLFIADGKVYRQAAATGCFTSDFMMLNDDHEWAHINYFEHSGLFDTGGRLYNFVYDSTNGFVPTINPCTKTWDYDKCCTQMMAATGYIYLIDTGGYLYHVTAAGVATAMGSNMKKVTGRCGTGFKALAMDVTGNVFLLDGTSKTLISLSATATDIAGFTNTDSVFRGAILTEGGGLYSVGDNASVVEITSNNCAQIGYGSTNATSYAGLAIDKSGGLRSFRYLNGAGVYTYLLANAATCRDRTNNGEAACVLDTSGQIYIAKTTSVTSLGTPDPTNHEITATVLAANISGDTAYGILLVKKRNA